MSREILRAQVIGDALRSRLLDARNESIVRLRGFSKSDDQRFADQVIAAIALPQLRTPLAAWSTSDSIPVSIAAGLNGLDVLRQIAIGEEVGVPGAPPPVDLDTKTFVQLTTSKRFTTLTGPGFPYSIIHPDQEWLQEELLRQVMVPDRKRLEDHRLSELDHDFALLKLNLLALVAGVHRSLRHLDAVNYWYERLPIYWKPRGNHHWLLASLVGVYVQALSMTATGSRECA